MKAAIVVLQFIKQHIPRKGMNFNFILYVHTTNHLLTQDKEVEQKHVEKSLKKTYRKA